MERKWRVLIVVCVAVFMLLLDITVVNVALPNIDKELKTSFTDLQWVVDAYALTLAATMLNAGSLGDLLGRKRVFLVAIALFTLASALCGSAQSPLWLILARAAQGFGGAGMFGVTQEEPPYCVTVSARSFCTNSFDPPSSVMRS